MEDKIFDFILYKDENILKTENSTYYSEEELIGLLSERIKYLMVHDKEHLWSLFYRLDVTDASLNKVLFHVHPENHPLELAKLVLERQKKRMETKLIYKQEPIDDEEWNSL